MTDKYYQTVIWKYPINVMGKYEIEMPFGGIIRHCDVQKNIPTIWIEFRLSATEAKPYITRKFQMFSTGFPIAMSNLRDYIGSFVLYDGDIVVHLYELE